MKKIITSLIAVSALLLAGCSKGISAEEAKKFINENYTSTEVKTATVTQVLKVTKSEGIFERMLPVGEKTYTYEEQLKPITAEEIDLFGNQARYSLDGKKLVIDLDGNLNDFLKSLHIEDLPGDVKIDGSYKITSKTDENGYQVESRETANATFNASTAGLAMNGSFAIEGVATAVIK